MMIPFCPVKPIRGGRALDGLFRKLIDDPMWICQAKLNGRRAVWDGKILWSRQRNPIGGHELTGIGQTMDGEWLDQTFFAFDLPDHGGDFRQRLDALERLVKSANRPGLQICPTTREWADVAKYEWEGVVFKNLNSLYPKAMQDGKTTPHWVKYRAEWGVHADIPAV